MLLRDACSFATSITTKAHLGHSNDRNPGVLVSSFMVARQLGQLFTWGLAVAALPDVAPKAQNAFKLMR
jgi:hypothetical protein